MHISATQVGPVDYLRDLQTSLFSNFFIKNESHDIIHIFKNYFAIVFSIFNFQFSVFSKISCIQMNSISQEIICNITCVL